MRRVTIRFITLIFIILAISVVYDIWWYFTPHIIAEKSTIFYATNITFLDNEKDRIVNETIMNVTYKGGMCEAEQIVFQNVLSEDNVNSLLSMANGIQFTKNGNFIPSYIEFNLFKMNGPITDGIALFKDKQILVFFCEQKNSNEYIARWFIDKYG